MNYAIVVLGAVLVFCIAYYYFPKYGGKTFFKGPVRTIDEVLDENSKVNEDVERRIAEEREVHTCGPERQESGIDKEN